MGVKISALASATTPLAGTEIAPIVQSGTTVSVSVRNIASSFSTTVTKTANYTLVSTTDFAVICTNAAFTITLPTAVGIQGRQFVIKNGNTLASGYAITLATNSSQTIDSAVPGTILPLNSITVISDNANWWII